MPSDVSSSVLVAVGFVEVWVVVALVWAPVVGVETGVDVFGVEPEQEIVSAASVVRSTPVINQPSFSFFIISINLRFSILYITKHEKREARQLASKLMKECPVYCR